MKGDDKVVLFNGVTRLDIPVDRVLSSAKKERLDEVVVMGFDKDGGFYFSSSKADGGSVLWLLEIAKKALLEPWS